MVNVMGGDPNARRQPIDLLDAGWLYRTIATLLALSAALNVAWLSLADGPTAARMLVGVSVLGIAAVAWVLLAHPPRNPRRFTVGTLLCCGVLVTVQTALAGPMTSPFALYYVWLAPFSFLVWEPRRAVLYVGALGVGFAGILARHAGSDLDHYVSTDLPPLLIGIGGIATVGWTVRAVCVQLGRATADAERAGEAHRLMAEVARKALADAGHDPLTGLLGRESFSVLLADRIGAGGTLMLLDVDELGLVSETLGPHTADVVLTGIVERVAAALPERATLARVGADELAVFDPEHDGEVAAIQLARRLQAAVKPPFDLDGATHHGSLSIGIVLCRPGRYDDDRAALRDAHVARRRARERGRGRHELYDEAAAAALEHRRKLEQELRLALQRREFRIVFQPVVELATGAITGAEALVRWQHPERGLVGPCEFIEAAEQSDIIVPLGDWVLREACRQLKAWQAGSDDFDGFRLAVNISGRQLADPGFVPAVRRMLERYELSPAALVFELTETALADESAQPALAIAELRELGIRLALDDFGTGYASISYVRRFAFDTLKLDRSFVAGMVDSDADRALITAAISMGSALGMELLAEGVETEEQAAQLSDLGCTAAQGFLFSRPVGGAAIRNMMRRRVGASVGDHLG